MSEVIPKRSISPNLHFLHSLAGWPASDGILPRGAPGWASRPQFSQKTRELGHPERKIHRCGPPAERRGIAMIVLAIRVILTRIRNTWVFMWQSFELIRNYRSLMLLPIISWVFCLLTSVIVLGGGALVFNIPIGTANFAPTGPRLKRFKIV